MLDGHKVLHVLGVNIEHSSESEKYDVLVDQELSVIVESGQVFALIDCGIMGQWYAHYLVNGSGHTCIKMYDGLYSVPAQLYQLFK